MLNESSEIQIHVITCCCIFRTHFGNMRLACHQNQKIHPLVKPQPHALSSANRVASAEAVV